MYSRPRARILDVDGTLCNVSTALHHIHKKPKDWDSFHRDTANCPPFQKAIDYAEEYYNKGETIIVCTGRMQKWHDVTDAYLKQHLTVPYDGPFMRQEDDFRIDVEVKREMFHYLSLSYDIRGAIDDSPGVIKLWKSLGLEVVEMERVEWGKFEQAK